MGKHTNSPHTSVGTVQSILMHQLFFKHINYVDQSTAIIGIRVRVRVPKSESMPIFKCDVVNFDRAFEFEH